MFVSAVHRGVAPPSGGIIEDGLIHRWNMDEGAGSTIADPYGGVNGTFAGGLDPATAWVLGRDGIRNALDLPGDGGYIDLASRVAVPSPLTFTFTTYHRQRWRVIMGNTTANSFARIQSPTSHIFKIGSVSDTLGDGGDVLNYWMGWAYTFNVDTVRFYKNGVFIDGNTRGSYIGQSVIVDYIGINNIFSEPYDGIMQDFRFYNRVLSDVEIAQIAAGTG